VFFVLIFTASEIWKLKIAEAVNIRTENTMTKRQKDKMTNNDL
jgi:hypothetical protein